MTRELGVVLVNVDSIRNAILAYEDSLGREPRACGSEREARLSLTVDPTRIGPCGVTYMGREQGPGAYWVEVSPGGVDFTVRGLLQQGDEVLEVRATRGQAAEQVRW